MGQKLDKAARGAYDAIVYIDGSEVVAEDADGRKIASGVAGTDDATVINNGLSSFTRGCLFLHPTETFHILSTISVGTQQSIEGKNTQIDVSTLNDTVFEFGAGGFYPQHLSSIRAQGTGTNTSTCLARFTDNQRGVVVEDVVSDGVCNIVLCEGICYLAELRNIIAYGINANPLAGGTAFKFWTSASYPSAGPNGVRLSHCWAEADGTSAPVSAISAYKVADLMVDSCWIESQGYSLASLYAVASGVRVTSGRIDSVNSFIFDGGEKSLSINGTTINSSEISISSGESINIVNSCVHPGARTALKVIGATKRITVSNNPKMTLYTGMPLINIAATVDQIVIEGNNITSYDATQRGKYVFNSTAAGIIREFIFSGNNIYNVGDGLATNVLNFLAMVTSGKIFGNNFDTVNSTYIINSLGKLDIFGNDFSSCIGAMNLHPTDKIHHNTGYTTENFGSSTGTGSEQTIAHGLSAIPTGCKAWIKYLVGTRYITEMVPFDATNIYPTVETGVAYEWRIE